MRCARVLAPLALAFAALPCAVGEPPPGEAKVVAHHLTVRLEPGARVLVATDRIDFDTSRGRRFRTPLGNVDEVPEGESSVVVQYRKPIQVEGDSIALTPVDGWYAESPGGGLARFDVTAYVPEPFVVVTQGGVPVRSTIRAPAGWSSETEVVPPKATGEEVPGVTYAACEVRATMPAPGLHLFAAPYRVATREVEGIAVSAFLLPSDAPSAKAWLNSAAEIVTRYEPILGAYPHPKFDVVEVTGPSRRDVPSCAVLSQDVVRGAVEESKKARAPIPPGIVERDYVRGWFGNALFPDPEGGDWAEAMTEYFASAGGRAGLPPRAMVVHMLRRRLGDARFFDAVRSTVAKRAGTRLSWSDWLAVLDGEWVRPWLERKELPAVRLASATAWPGEAPGTWEVRCEAVANAPVGEAPWPAFDLDVDVNGKKVGTVRVGGIGGVWRGTVSEEPREAEVDARAEVARVLPFPGATKRSVDRGGEATKRILADVTRLASDEFSGRRPGTEGHRRTVAWLIERLDALAGTPTTKVQPFALGVGDLTSPRDFLLVTDAGTETVKDGFRPLFNSGEREAGKPLRFAEGAGAIPLPAKIPDTSPEGLALFQQMVESDTAPAILLDPSRAARRALLPLLDAPNALTPESTAEHLLSHPPLAPWIAARRARQFPAAAPLRVPVLVLSEEAAARLEKAPRVKAIDFAVSFSGDREAWAEGGGGENVIAYLPALGADTEKPPVVLVSAHFDSFGKDGAALYRGADDGASGVACVLEALSGLLAEAKKGAAWKRGLVVALFDGEEWGSLGSRAFTKDIASRYDVKAAVHVDAVGRVRDGTAFVLGPARDADLGTKATEALKAAGLERGRDMDPRAWAAAGAEGPFPIVGTPSVTLFATDPAVLDSPEDVPERVDPVGIARVSWAVRTLLLRLLTE